MPLARLYRLECSYRHLLHASYHWCPFTSTFVKTARQLSGPCTRQQLCRSAARCSARRHRISAVREIKLVPGALSRELVLGTNRGQVLLQLVYCLCVFKDFMAQQQRFGRSVHANTAVNQWKILSQQLSCIQQVKLFKRQPSHCHSSSPTACCSVNIYTAGAMPCTWHSAPFNPLA